MKAECVRRGPEAWLFQPVGSLAVAAPRARGLPVVSCITAPKTSTLGSLCL